jgi:hypothetical protein
MKLVIRMKKTNITIIILFLFSILLSPLTAATVKVKNRHIIVDDTVYVIKGICYNPIPSGSNQRNFSSLGEDLELMIEAGINTIRIYAPIDDVLLLDMINKAGIKLIVSFGYNQDGFYDILSGSFIDYIDEYKNHDVILFWELGNEYNFHPEWFEGEIENWYTALNSAADLIHQIDSEHPVATAHGELPSNLAISMSTNIDIWGLNVYRWDNPEDIFSEYAAISNKPMYLSEAGADSYMTGKSSNYEMGKNEIAQADATANILNDVFDYPDICSGVTIFAFVDELWKAGDNDKQDIGGWAPKSSGVPYDGTANEEFWGIVDINRKTKLAYDIVKKTYMNLGQ